MYIDLLTRIKNAQAVGKEFVFMPYSKMDYEVAKLLEERGFLKKVERKGRSPKRALKIFLESPHRIRGVKILSKPSVRRSKRYRELRPSKGGYGTVVLSTPKGIISGERARKERVGGQLLFEIW